MNAGTIIIAAVYLTGAYIAAFLGGRFDWEDADAIALFWPIWLVLAVAATLVMGPVWFGMLIYHAGRDMRERR